MRSPRAAAPSAAVGGRPVPAAVAALDAAFDGQSDEPQLPRYPWRLMPADEVIRIHDLMQAQAGWLSPAPNVRYVWSDDNSNWAGVFVTGPLAGMVHVLDTTSRTRCRAIARWRASSLSSCARITRTRAGSAIPSM